MFFKWSTLVVSVKDPFRLVASPCEIAVIQCIATKKLEKFPIFCSDWLSQVAADSKCSVIQP